MRLKGFGVGVVGLCCVVGALGPGCGADAATAGGGASGPVGGSGGSGAAGGGGGCVALCGFEQVCCVAGEECVNDQQCLPACEGDRCGANLVECCGAGQACLDGAECAADCSPTQSLCGPGLDVCCSEGDYCINDACVTPGESCDNDFDCAQDGWYCEEIIAQCLPLPTGELCEGHPTFNEIDPTVEWYWPGVDYNEHYYQNILASPVVGDVDGDGTPDVVVVAYYGGGGAGWSDQIIVVLKGDGDGNGNGEVLFTIPSAADPTAPYAAHGVAVALANFDDDPGLEIVYNTAGGGLRIADNDGIGDVCDTATYPGCSGVRDSGGIASAPWVGGPSIADLDHDGFPDVVLRCHAVNGRDVSNPSLDFMDITDADCAYSSVVADLDQDGRPEVIDAQHAVSADPNVAGGDPLWSGSGFPIGIFMAVADILPAVPGPEVIDINSALYILDGQTGAVLAGATGSLYPYAIPIPGGGTGGPPTVADFDGDGLPEISTAGLTSYVVYDPDCTSPAVREGGQCASSSTNFELWRTPTQDLSSSITGSSVFDFQGDGPAEVLYNDECFLHIYDGTTGAQLVTPTTPNSSRTAAEYPLVADVDGDGNSEIVVVANNDGSEDRDNCDYAWKQSGADIDWLCRYGDCLAGGACGVDGACPTLSSHGTLSADYYQCDSQSQCQLALGTHGVKVFGDSFDRWVKTRPIWNQFAYHITNIEFQGGQWRIPDHEEANWLSFNNYRQNVQGGILFPVPNLQVEVDATPVCPDEVKLTATVRNIGSAGAPAGVPVRFFRIDDGASSPPELLSSVDTTGIILPGGWERVSTVFPNPPAEVELQFRASVDPDAAIEECDDLDNEADSPKVSCSTGPR